MFVLKAMKLRRPVYALLISPAGNSFICTVIGFFWFITQH